MSEYSNVVEPHQLSLEEGTYLVKLARKAIEEYVTKKKRLEVPQDAPEKLKSRGMAFVTIDKLSGEGKELRGCIGFLQPISSLLKVVIDAAIAAATEDPRFPPLQPEELSSVLIEVSVLSLPKPVSNPLKDIVIGRHGIIIMKGWHSGTLLPQVPVDYCWDTETFLAEGCLKAGLEPDCWLDQSTKILAYEAIVFYEEKPGGEVKSRRLDEDYRDRCRWML
ncbi:MAG TPA: TIGR00296 family protein [Ignisphaera sp.]|nr:TIGR00296 family protein [Ignisphaera sp.]